MLCAITSARIIPSRPTQCACDPPARWCSPHGRTMGDEGGDAGGGGGEGHGEGEGAAAVATGEIVTVVTVAMAVGISFTLHLLEVGIRRFKYSTLMLKMIFRETMIVGVVSAVLYGMERTDTSIEHDQVALSCTVHTALPPSTACQNSHGLVPLPLRSQELFEEVHMTMYCMCLICTFAATRVFPAAAC